MVFSSIFTSNNIPQNILEENNTYLNTNNYIFQGNDNDNTNNNLFNKTLYELGIHKELSNNDIIGDTVLSSTSNFTIMMWLYLDINGLSSNETYYNVLGTGTLNISVYNNINNNSGNIFFGFQYLSSNDSLNVEGFENKSWQHITCVYEYPYQKIYINGLLKGINYVTVFERDISNSDRFVKLGKPYTVTDTNKRWIGQISNIFIFDKALIQYEIDNYKNNYINNVYYEPPNLLYELPLQFDLDGSLNYYFNINPLERFVDPGFTLKDANNIFVLYQPNYVEITGLNDICYNLTGSYTITYKFNYQDIEIIKQRNIYVIDVSNLPRIKLLGDNPHNFPQYSSNYIDPGYTVYDINFGGDISNLVTSNAYNINLDISATYTITYSIFNLPTTIQRTVNIYELSYVFIEKFSDLYNIPTDEINILGSFPLSAISYNFTDDEKDVLSEYAALSREEHAGGIFNSIKEPRGWMQFNNLTNNDISYDYMNNINNYLYLYHQEISYQDGNGSKGIMWYSDNPHHSDVNAYNGYYLNISGSPDGSLNNIPNDFFINNLINNNDILFKEFKSYYLYQKMIHWNPYIIYDICDNAYYKLDFIYWRSGGGSTNDDPPTLIKNPAFGYNRTRIKARFDINSDWYQEIIQNNNILPILELSGNTNITFRVNTEYIEPGYIAYHPLLGVITSNVTISSILNTSVRGSYTITYTITDYPGPHSVSKTRTINVFNPPTISLTGNTTVYVTIDTNYNEPGYSAYDDDLGDITNLVDVSDNINISTEGTYSVSYSVSNDYLTTTVYRSVIVTTDYIINSFSDLFNIGDTISVTINENNYQIGDEISEYVTLTRARYGGIYNLAKGETSFDQSISTKGVQWYSGTINNDLNFNNISNDWFSNNNWESFYTYKNDYGLNQMDNANPWIIYDMCDNAYYKIDFTYWAVGILGELQGFSYTRTNVPARFSS